MWFSLLRTKLGVASIFVAISSFLSISSTFAQADQRPFSCGADEYWEAKAKQNPALKTQRQQLLNQILKNEASSFKKDGQEEVRIIPVVFHVIHQYGLENISRQKILDQINTLNETFNGKNKDTQNVRSIYKGLIANSKVEFRLATKDPNGNCTDGVVRVYSDLTNNANDNTKAVSYWNSDNYLNIWVVSSITNFGQAGTVLGYAQFPWDPTKTTDGIIVRADQVTAGNKTLTHEIGHYLGLMHTFESAMGNGCGGNCTSSGDLICDTPPSTGPTGGCPASTYNTCKSDNPDMPDMTENFMDYSSCTRMFTLGQKARMDNVFSTTKRAYLVSEENLLATGVADGSVSLCKPVADFYATQYVICEGGSITFKDNTYNGLPSTYTWSFAGGNPAISSLKDPVIKFDKAGTYEVTLEVANSAGSSKTERTALITVLPAVSDIKAPVVQDFENFDLDKAGYAVNSDDRGIKWSLNSNASAGGSNSFYLNNISGTDNYTYTVTLPAVDMTTTNDKKLTFNLAYAQVASNTNDELRVQVSSNCGQNFSTMYYKFGSKLTSTSTLYTSSFIPDLNEWKQEEIDLSSYKNTKNLIIRFSLKNHGGNNLYIDNINIGGISTSIESKHFSGNAYMEIYPNPAASEFSLRTTDAVTNGNLEVFDASGKKISTLQGLNIGKDQALQLNKNILNITAGGVYYIKLHTANASYVEKLIISK
jgi:PKD repeat protein